MTKKYLVNEDLVGKRIDQALSILSGKSRSFIKEQIDLNQILVNNKVIKASYKVNLNDEIILNYEEEKPLELKPKDLNLDIIYEDNDLAVINKPKGLVVHPAPGHYDDTLVSGLLYSLDKLSGINGVIRPGIVHRIDKDTSGLLVVAKNDETHNFLTNLLKTHSIKRKYLAIAIGHFKEKKFTINMPIKRSSIDRKKMCCNEGGKEAITHVKVVKEFKNNSLIECELETGRTHQIRVHLSYLNHPLLGDPLYGPKKVYGTIGQYLHAYELSFVHPRTNKLMTFTCPLPKYFEDEIIKENGA